MSDDFQDLFSRDHGAASTSPTRNMAASSFAAFDETDGFGSGINPFADLQSSSIGAFEQSEEDPVASVAAFQDTSARSRTSSNATERRGNDSGNGWEQHHPKDVSVDSGSSIAEQINDEEDGEVDRVLVSPFVSNPGSSSGEGDLQDQDADPMASTVTAFYQDETPSVPSFDISHIESDADARGFADYKQVTDDSAEPQHGYNDERLANDAASIRTVGLESDGASLRSQKTQVCTGFVETCHVLSTLCRSLSTLHPLNRWHHCKTIRLAGRAFL